MARGVVLLCGKEGVLLCLNGDGRADGERPYRYAPVLPPTGRGVPLWPPAEHNCWRVGGWVGGRGEGGRHTRLCGSRIEASHLGRRQSAELLATEGGAAHLAAGGAHVRQQRPPDGGRRGEGGGRVNIGQDPTSQSALYYLRRGIRQIYPIHRIYQSFQLRERARTILLPSSTIPQTPFPIVEHTLSHTPFCRRLLPALGLRHGGTLLAAALPTALLRIIPTRSGLATADDGP